VQLRFQQKQLKIPKQDLIQADKRKLTNEWRDMIRNDPAFNPNLVIHNGKIGINTKQDQADSSGIDF
jgi:hypothetical protein